MFGIDAEKFFVLLIIGALVIGPTKLPEYAAKLGRLVRELRRMANTTREQLREELGPEFDDLDWQKLDPRQYDPRRIIRDALAEDEPAERAETLKSAPGPSPARAMELPAAGAPAPFDAEAT